MSELLHSPKPNPLAGSEGFKKLIAYGAGNALLGLQAGGGVTFDYVVDDTPGYAGQRIANLDIRPSAALLNENPCDIVVVICAQTSTAALRIAQRLEGTGLRPGVDFVDCAVLQAKSIARRLALAFGIDADLDVLQPLLRFSATCPVRNLSGTSGTWLFLALVAALEKSGVPGDVAECGVYQGANALSALTVSEALRLRTYHLLDSFEGLQTLSSDDPEARRGEFLDTSVDTVQRLLAPFPKAKVHCGRFDSTLPGISDLLFSLGYIDCDLAEPARFCGEFLWDRLCPGGFLLVHDYWFSPISLLAGAPAPFFGIRAVMDEFMAGRPAETAVFPETSHLVMRKPVRL